MNDTEGFWAGFKDLWRYIAEPVEVPSRKAVGEFAAFYCAALAAVALVFSLVVGAIYFIGWLL